MRTTRALPSVAVLALAALLPFSSACGDESGSLRFAARSTGTSSPDEPPPFIGPPPAPPPLAHVEKKELIATDEELLAAGADGTRPEAPWSFRHLVEMLAAPGDPQVFVRSWLATWQRTATDASEGSLPLDVRAAVRSELACRWLHATPANACDATCGTCASEIYDLAKAPFRLLAIVNRLDLSETTSGCVPDAAEGRLVFVAVRDGVVQPLSLIFEYAVDGTKAGDPSAWHALGGLSGPEYGAALEALTRSFTDATRSDLAPSRLKQLRTSENLGVASGASFELRQFVLKEGMLAPTALTNTAVDFMNGTTTLTKHVKEHFSQIFAGDNAITSAQRTAVSTLPSADFKWVDDQSETNREMDLFGLSTCNGCHGGHRGDTTSLPFSHIGVNSMGQTVLSRFLQDPSSGGADELSFRGRSLARRIAGECGDTPEATYGGRRGGGGIPKRERDARVMRTH